MGCLSIVWAASSRWDQAVTPSVVFLSALAVGAAPPVALAAFSPAPSCFYPGVEPRQGLRCGALCFHLGIFQEHLDPE